jgi:hypothetical protein
MNPADDDKDLQIAVTFAEAGEWRTARAWTPPPRSGRLGGWLERHLLAAALAEEGLHDAARDAVADPAVGRGPGAGDPLDALLRARGVRMFCGVLSPAALATRR